MRAFIAPDGVAWGVEVQSPGASNAMVVFHHPNGETARLDRYNWYNSHAPESHSVTARLDPALVEQALTDRDLARLFRRSMPIDAKSAGVSLVNLASGLGGATG
jgi:hypothetical protein